MLQLLTITYSRSDADIIGSLLASYDVYFYTKGYYHGSASIIALGLGGYQISVPEEQHLLASDIMRSIPNPKNYFSVAHRKTVLRFLLVYFALLMLPMVAIKQFSDEEYPNILFGDMTMHVFSSVPVNLPGVRSNFLSFNPQKS